MAKVQSKKTGSTAGRNPDRRNGKAWKKDRFKPTKKRTDSAELRYIEVLARRHRQKEENIARRAEEARLAELLAEAKAAQKAAELEAKAAAEVEMLEEQARKSRERSALKKVALAIFCYNTTTTIDHAPCVLEKGHRISENPTPCRSRKGQILIDYGVEEILAMLM